MLLEAAIAELPRGEVMMGSRASTTTMTLLQDDHEFSSRILKKDVSNRARFAYKSSATIQAGGIPFQWETEPGKLKSLNTKDEEEYMFPITLPPIRIPSSSNSPSSSRAQSPSSSTSKVIKSLVMNVKRPESSTNHSQESSFSRSPSTISSPREKKSFLSSLYEPLQSSGSPHCSATSNLGGESHFNSEDFTPSRSTSNLVYRSPLLYSPYTPSPYYFSPLSNTSSQSSDTTSRQNSIAHGPDPPAEFNPITTSHGLEKPKTHPNASNGSISSTPRALGNPPLFIPAFSNAVEDNGVQNGGDSLSFASPEMEILDEGLMANYNASRGAENTMAEFINRGGPKMHRSFSTSRVTFADDYKRKSTQRKYYSAQLNASEQPKKNVLEVQDPTCSALDKLFPLKRPNQFKAGTAMASNSHLEEQMDVNLGCSNVGGMGHLSTLLEIRAAQEVVIQASDEEGFAYTPVASAFVFSPRRASQNSYFMRSSSAKVLKERGASTNQGQQEIKSILKKTSYSHELVHGVHTESQRALHHPGSHKISSVLLRFAEAQERLYNSAPTSPHHHRHHHSSTMPTTTCLQPMCSFLGRAFLCRSKLATGGHLHE